MRLLICIFLGLLGSIYCTDIGFYLLEFVDLYGTTISFMGGLAFEVFYFGR